MFIYDIILTLFHSSISTPIHLQKVKAYDLNDFVDKQVIVEVGQYRQFTGTLVGWDDLGSVVLKNVTSITNKLSQSQTESPTTIEQKYDTILLRAHHINSVVEAGDDYVE